MRINKQKHIKRNIIIAATILVVAGAGIGWALLRARNDNVRPENTVDYNKSTDVQKQAGNEAKEAFIKSHEENSGNSATGDVPRGQVDSSSIPIEITFARQQDQGGPLQVRTVIGTTQSGGSCKLTLSRAGSSPITQTAASQSMGSYSTCQGFDIITTDLTKGQWTVRIDFQGADGNGSAEGKADVT